MKRDHGVRLEMTVAEICIVSSSDLPFKRHRQCVLNFSFHKTPGASSLHYKKGRNLTKRGIIAILSMPLSLQTETAFTLAFPRRTKTVSDKISQTSAVFVYSSQTN